MIQPSKNLVTVSDGRMHGRTDGQSDFMGRSSTYLKRPNGIYVCI